VSIPVKTGKTETPYLRLEEIKTELVGWLIKKYV